jgi:alpha-methylacyl-CoA racemase
MKVVEFAGLGPAPFCGMLLSDLGADVVRIDRKGGGPPLGRFDVTFRGRRSVALDLKTPAAVAACLDLIERAEALVEGFRPGVMERLGLGPDVALARNPNLVYGRMTGWGQEGAWAQAAGHDLNYIAVSGALHGIGTPERPTIPINLVGDYGGGALYLAFGLLAGILHARAGGGGQVIDAAMTDGSVSLMAQIYGNLAAGYWRDAREANIIDGGSHFYNVYCCADGEWLAVAAIEPQFYRSLRDRAGLTDPAYDAQMDRDRWPELKAKLAAVFAAKPLAEWLAVFEGSDACVSPVLGMEAAPDHPYNRERGSFVTVDGIRQPAPAPRFSKTPGQVRGPVPAAGEHNEAALADWGFSDDAIAGLKAAGAL